MRLPLYTFSLSDAFAPIYTVILNDAQRSKHVKDLLKWKSISLDSAILSWGGILRAESSGITLSKLMIRKLDQLVNERGFRMTGSRVLICRMWSIGWN